MIKRLMGIIMLLSVFNTYAIGTTNNQVLKSAFDHYENDVHKIKTNLPLTYSLLMCPLLWPYFLAEVNNPASIKKALTSMIQNEFNDVISNDILNELFLARHKGLAFVSRLPIVGWTQ